MIREFLVSGALKSLTGQRQYETELFLTIRKICCLSGKVRMIVNRYPSSLPSTVLWLGGILHIEQLAIDSADDQG